MRLDELPAEILISIIQFAGYDQVYGGLSQTCERLRHICTNSTILWKDLYEAYCRDTIRAPSTELDKNPPSSTSVSYKDRFYRQTVLNSKIKRSLQQLCAIPTYRSQMESIDNICRYKARAYPVILPLVNKSNDVDLQSEYGLALAYWSRQLFLVINFLRGSDRVIALCKENDTVQKMLQIVFNCGYFSDLYRPEDSLLLSHDFERFVQILQQKVAAKRLQNELSNPYQVCKFILHESGLQTLDLDVSASFGDAVVTTQEFVQLLEHHRAHHQTDHHTDDQTDEMIGPDAKPKVQSFFLGCVVAYLFSSCGVDVQLLDDSVYQRLMFRVDIKSGTFDSSEVHDMYILNHGDGHSDAAFFFDAANLGEFRSLDYVQQMFSNDDPQTSLAYINTVADLSKKFSNFGAFYPQDHNAVYGGLASYLLTCLLTNVGSSEEKAAASQLCAYINKNCRQAFPVLENLIAHRQHLSSALAASIATIASEFILPETELQTKVNDRSPGTPLKFHVGDIVETMHYSKLGCVVGWNENYDFESENNVSASVPTYLVLTAPLRISDRAYEIFKIPQNMLKKITEFTEPEKREALADLISTNKTYELGRYFVRWDAINSKMVPSRWLAAEYPDDFLE